MRFLLAESENEDSDNLFDGLDLSFSADVLYQEGGGQVSAFKMDQFRDFD